MKALYLNAVTSIPDNPKPLELVEIDIPEPSQNELLLKVSTCGVCHTELDEIEGRTPPAEFPVIPGHQVVGFVEKTGSQTTQYEVGDRVGVAWIYSSCGHCKYCQNGNENLCAEFKATGRDADGGYAEFMVAPESSVFRIPEGFSDTEAAPLLCAGAIGYRSLKLAEIDNGDTLGLMGFGGSGHLVLKQTNYLYPASTICVFSRTNSEREFALELGADWAGDIDAMPPLYLDAIIETTPVWRPVVESLRFLASGGRLVINAIRKEDIDKDYLLNLEYSSHLWMEKEIKSVANVTRADVSEFLDLAAKIPIKPETQLFQLEEANRALVELKTRKIRGAKVLNMS